MDELLKVENVEYTYGNQGQKVPAIQKASGAFGTGKLYAIVGRSGSGKTTLLSLMAGLDLPTKGKVYFRGKSLDAIDRNRYRSHDVGIIFQSFNLLPHLTVLENTMLSLDFSGLPRKEWKSRAGGLLETVGIDAAMAKRKALRLSGGEQQRVAIARALGPNPPLILADEPTGNLDNETSDSIMELLVKAAHEEGRCVIVITHATAVAKLADEVWGMKDGMLLPVKTRTEPEA